MTRIICIASGKGGVGKTTLVANLATALSQFNQSVIAVDGNLTTSNLGLHLGIPLYPVTLQDVMKKKAPLQDAMYYHQAGFRIIPADVSFKKIMTPKSNSFIDVFYNLVGKANFVLIDSAAGLGREALAALKAADELITITNPEMPAIIDALKLREFANKFGTKNLGLVVNRVKKQPHEVPLNSIENFLDMPLLGHVPEDHNVSLSVAKREPVLTYNPKSRASEHFKAIAATLIGVDYKPRRFFSLFGWLR